MREIILAGNWKMNKLVSETKTFFSELIPLVRDCKNTIVVCTPYTDLATGVESVKSNNIHIGAQNAHWEEKGAFTGEISPSMLGEIGVKYVIIGHSERRQYFGETNQTVAKRTKAVLNAGLKAIVCVGETLTERNSSITEKILTEQLCEGFYGITAEEMKNVIIAYEPVWAIGTGVTATTDQAQETIHFVRKTIEKIFDSQTANVTPILYGGSMNEKNAAELLSMPDIDGGLIGGASLTAEKFAVICNAANSK